MVTVSYKYVLKEEDMRLELTNFAKIKNASIEIDGITIIAGNNNTGKSTIGKALFCMFNSLYDIAEQVDDQRRKRLYAVCTVSLRNTILRYSFDKYRSTVRTRQLSQKICRALVLDLEEKDASNLTREIFKDCVKEALSDNGIELQEDAIDEYVETVYPGVIETKEMKDEHIAHQLIYRFFSNVFDGQIQNLEYNGKTEIQLQIKNKKVSIAFENNECIDWNPKIDILHNAFFIDDPFILDELKFNTDFNIEYMSNSNMMRSFLLRRIIGQFKQEEQIIETVLAKEKLKEVYKLLREIAPGNISTDLSDGTWALESAYYNEPIMFGNLSAGLKAFVLLRLLLEKSILKDKDVLVLDEPEIHLHPEWQIKYAEIIVMLQKAFDLSIVVTTHSQEFLEAIELFSKKHRIQEKCNYYLAVQNEGISEFKCVTNDITEIYRQLVTPSMYLDRIRFELEDENE